MACEYAKSSDGTKVAYFSYGSPSLPSLLLIHGWAQQSMCWRDLCAHLQDRFHIVAMDLRGHGASDKPPETAAYTDKQLWADDVRSVIDAAGLKQPILVGWSYGARVIAAYLAAFGDADLAGIALAGGILAIGEAREDWMMGPSSPGLDRDLYTEDIPRRLAATARFVDACTATPLPRSTYAELVGANMLCPAHVRRALFAASVDFRPVYAKMTRPALVIHGVDDAVVSLRVGQCAAETIPNGRLVDYDGVGHAPFLEDTDRFAEDLARFRASI